MKKTQELETREINMPRIVCKLLVHVDLDDDSEMGSPKVTPRSLLTVDGTIDDFKLSYPLSMGAELTIDKLPLGTVEKLIIEDNGESLNIFAETSGQVFIKNAKQNLAKIAARYKALKLKVTSVRGLDMPEAVPILKVDSPHFTIRSTIKETMKPVVNISPNKTALEAANLMKESNRGSLLIVDGKTTVGIITERDFVTRVVARNLPLTTPVSEVMSSPLISINANTTLKEAARIMSKHRIRRLPVTEHGRVAGILVASDMLRQLSKKTLTEEIWKALTGEHQ
jgi:CBS domain-containing protein